MNGAASSRYGGVGQIVRFNWPWYAAAAAATVVAAALLALVPLPAPWPVLAFSGLLLADLWLVLSLAVSHWIYDRSSVSRGEWLCGIAARRVVVCHFGQDEATRHVARWLPAAAVQVFDLFDGVLGTPSLRRARALSHQAPGTIAAPSAAAPLDALPLGSASQDLAVLAFAAHEVRDHATRVRLCTELARCLAPDGTLLVVEHLRDAWNLLAYGPGGFHFLARRTWLRTFAAAGLAVVGETSLTPWVRRFALRKEP